MDTGAGRDSERFAAAVDNGHSYTGAVPPGDELLARDLELVALLRESRASLAPTSDASARMRAKVMAAAGTMMAPTPGIDDQIGSSPTAAVELDGFDAETVDDSNVVSIGSAKGRHRFPRRAAAADSAPRRGGIGVSAAAALTLLAITGGGALFSKDALPGDTLYGVKQATESGQIALSGTGKAQRQLDIAATRIDEVQELNSGHASSSDRSADISQALHGFNEQTTAASRTWLAGPNPGNAATLANWASTQSQRLTAMRSSMPTSAQSDADSSIRMLDQVRTRASALNGRKGCGTVSSGQADEFGPIPAKGACSAQDTTAAPKQVLPGLPSPSQRATAPSSGSQHSGSGESRRDGSDSVPGLELPGLTDSGGLLPNRVQTDEPSEQQPTNQRPGLLGGLLGGN